MKHLFTRLLSLAALTCLLGSATAIAAPPASGTAGKLTLKEMFSSPQQSWRLLPRVGKDGASALKSKPKTSRRNASASASPVIYASMIENSSWGSSKAYGMYSFNASEYGFTALKQNFNFNATGGAGYIGDDNYVSISAQDFGGFMWVEIVAFDTNSWADVYNSYGDDTNIATDMAWCPVDNKTYGCFNNSSSTGYVFGMFDSDTFQTTAISDLNEAWIACGSDAAGKIFAVTRSGKLVSADRTSGTITEIGDTGLTSENLTSGAIDPSTGIFYVATCNSTGSALYTVDTTSAASTLLYDMADNEELVGMYVAVPALNPNAPAAPSDLTAVFAENSLEGTVNFTAPDLTIGGTNASGELTYTISTADGEIASGTTTPGAAVEAPVTLPAAGTYEITVVCANASGAGASASICVMVTSEKDPDNLISLPYLEEFSTQAAFDGYTVIDNNNDRWTYIYWANRGCALCQFNYDNDKTGSDDYFVTPPVRLEKDKAYIFSCDTYRRSAPYKESYEIVMGTEPTAEKLTTVLQGTYMIADDDTHRPSLTIVPEKTGIYYLAIHCTSPANQYGLCVDNVSISSGSFAAAPAAPSIEVTPDFGGDTFAMISVTAPSKTIGGDDLSAISSIVVLRDGEPVHTFDSPAAGSTLSYKDQPEESGYHTYSAYAVNEFGDGRMCEQRVFVGINYPATPRNITIAETENLGEVTMTWEAPATDCDGNVLNPELVTYMIGARMSNGNMQVVARGVKETSYTLQALNPETETQRFVSYMIFAETAKGVNDWQVTSTPSIPVGKPFEMPYREPFGGETLSPLLTGTSHYTDKWEISDMAEDQDGDGYFLMYTGVQGSRGTVSTAKIHVSGENPSLSFWYMCIQDTDAVIEVSVSDGRGFIELATVALSEGNDMEWTNFTTSLEAYAGKDIQIKLAYSAKGYLLAIDNISVFNPTPVELEARAITVPMRAFPEVPFQVRLLVSNNGGQSSGTYTADLYRNGKKVDSATCESIDAFGSTLISFTQTVSSMSESVVSYYIVLNCENDADTSNNTSLTTTLDLVQHDFPCASNLTAIGDGKSVTLSWEAPVINSDPIRTQDNIESYTAFSCGLDLTLLPNDNVGDWTMVNADGGQCYVISIDGVPYYFPNAYERTSFVVLNAEKAGLPEHWSGHNGSAQCFMAMASMGVTNDKWLISPMLSGNEQVIKFFAKSQSDAYGLESFEVLYSMSGKNITDFVKVGEEIGSVPTDWTEYSYDIPEGAKYFAVRSISDDVYALMLDDFTFEAAHPHSSLVLNGYNVYRDGEKISGNPVAAAEHIDAAPESEAHIYNVTALYNNGESAPSNSATITIAGIAGVDAAVVKVSAERGCILVENAAGKAVNVFGTDGRASFSGIVSDDVRISVVPGIYLVEIEGHTVKVSVK